MQIDIALNMAIEALSENISEDGTLKVKVEDGSKVNRVLVQGDNIFGGLYYPDRPPRTVKLTEDIDKTVDEESYEIGYTHGQMADRPNGEWISNPTDAIDLMFAKPKCPKCGFESSDGGNFCPNCGADMRGEENDIRKSNNADKNANG